jgi:pyridoxal phosphate enzyme (YggS family)
MTDCIYENLRAIRLRMQAACERAGRCASDVELVAVSKTFPAESVREAFEAGERVFGESRLQEALPKMELLPSSIHWHFIGGLQRNKVRKVLAGFDVIHAVDSLKLARHVNEVAGEMGLFPKVFIQVNVGGEKSKGGFEMDECRMVFGDLLVLERLEFLGLMCIPPAGDDAESARPWFVSLRVLRAELESTYGVLLPKLSMGMSNDFEIAIEEGATHVRVGSSIFGKRAYRVDGELG